MSRRVDVIIRGALLLSGPGPSGTGALRATLPDGSTLDLTGSTVVPVVFPGPAGLRWQDADKDEWVSDPDADGLPALLLGGTGNHWSAATVADDFGPMRLVTTWS